MASHSPAVSGDLCGNLHSHRVSNCAHSAHLSRDVALASTRTQSGLLSAQFDLCRASDLRRYTAGTSAAWLTIASYCLVFPLRCLASDFRDLTAWLIFAVESIARAAPIDSLIHNLRSLVARAHSCAANSRFL